MSNEVNEEIAKNREFLKANLWGKPLKTDQKKGEPVPPPRKSYSRDIELIDLIPAEEINVGDQPLLSVMKERRSRRKFTEENFTKEEFSFLIWAVQGLNSEKNILEQHLQLVPVILSKHM